MKRLRKLKEWTQEKAAEHAHFSVRYWQQLESGENDATLRTLTQIARALEVECNPVIKTVVFKG